MNDIMPLAATWINLETVSQKEKDISYNIAYMWNPKQKVRYK